jgi:hypothetical protein
MTQCEKCVMNGRCPGRFSTANRMLCRDEPPTEYGYYGVVWKKV